MAFSEVPRRKGVFSMATAVLILGAGSSLLIYGGEVPAAQAQSTARPVGTIKTVSGNTITLTTDVGSDVTILVQDSTKFVRIAPGQKDLKDATTMALADLQTGDRILVRGNHVEHWLNGAKVLEYELGSDTVKNAVAKSKFKNVAGFGTKIRGHILLTEHHDEASFRNVKIRALLAK